MSTKIESYNGFDIGYFIAKTGFNQYTLTITRLRYEGTREEEYYMKRINTYESYIKDARKIARDHIDSLDLNSLPWSNNGYANCESRPHRIEAIQ